MEAKDPDLISKGIIFINPFVDDQPNLAEENKEEIEENGTMGQ